MVRDPASPRSAPRSAPGRQPRSTTAASSSRSSRRPARAIDQVLARLRTKLAKIQGITLYMQAAQDITIGGRVRKRSISTRSNDADPGELDNWAECSSTRSGRSRASPTSRPISSMRAAVDIAIEREVASSYGILPYTIDNTLDDAFGQRIVSTMYTTLNQYHVVLEVDPKFQYGPEALNGIYVKSSSGQQVPLSHLVESVVKVAPLVGQPSGPVPVGDDLLQPAPGVAIGQAVSAIQRSRRSSASRRSRCRPAFGQRPGLRRSLSSTPILMSRRCSSSTSFSACCTRA